MPSGLLRDTNVLGRSSSKLAILFLAAGLGCSNLNRRPPGTPPPSGPGGVPPAQFPGNKDPILQGSATVPNGSPGLNSAVLAGRVIDRFGQPPVNASIRWVCVDEKDKQAVPPEIAVNPQGYFTIQGLKPGSAYKLIARSQNGQVVQGNVVYTTAPNVRVLIQVKEEFAAPEGGTSGTDDKISGLPADGSWAPGSQAQGPGQPAPPRLSLEPDLPTVRVPQPPPAPNSPEFRPQKDPAWVPGITEKETTWPPRLEIPRRPEPRPVPATPTLPPVTPPAIPDPAPVVPAPTQPGSLGGVDRGNTVATGARIPSCVLVGRQLVNFALNDLNGEPWEFRHSRRGKLILLDFWGTACMPCRQSLPFLKELHDRYASKGLEIVGLAYESGGSQAEQAYRVDAVCRRLHLAYRQLLGAGPQCPVRTQFGVRFIPTMVLLDENGWILWRHEGLPEPGVRAELERLIQRRLPERDTVRIP